MSVYFSGGNYLNQAKQKEYVREIRTDIRTKPKSRKKKTLTKKKKTKKKYDLTQLKKQLGNDMIVKLLLKLLDKRTYS